MVRTVKLLACLFAVPLLLNACAPKESTSARPASPEAETPRAAEETTTAPAGDGAGAIGAESKPAPEPAEAVEAPPQATTILVRNGGSAPMELDVTFGDAEVVDFVDEAGRYGNLGLNGHGGQSCADSTEPLPSARPEPRTLELAPGAEHRIAWNGKLNRYTEKGCYEELLPAGPYVFRACGRPEDGCAVRTVTLPTAEPIELVLDGTSPQVSSCPLDDKLVARTLARLLESQARPLVGPNDPRASSCSTAAARCVAAGEEPPTATEGCTLLVIAAGGEIEGRMLLAAADGKPALSYGVVVDAAAVSLLRVKR